MTLRTTTIELCKDYLKFSAGHFTIFSATERERLHGHNYTVSVLLTASIKGEGLKFDYRNYKKKIYSLCSQLDEIFLLPGLSSHLKIVEKNDYIDVYFNNEKIPFLKKDVLILPLKNITLEELSYWFIQGLISDTKTLITDCIEGIVVKVYSSPGQSASSAWLKSQHHNLESINHE
jgi:6-pyruvoyltetrahydropterin/6-carboxytetrahydropterin synthase